MIEKILDYTKTEKDNINFIEKEHIELENLKKYTTKEQIEISLKDLTLIENLKNIKSFQVQISIFYI